MYAGFIEEIDAVDNGISQYEGAPKYKVCAWIGVDVRSLHCCGAE